MVDADQLPTAKYHKRWTLKDDEFLCKFYNEMLNRDIDRALGKSTQAIQCRAKKLGLL